MNRQRKGRWMLLFLLGVFALPVIVGLALYFAGWRPDGTSHGDLLQPPRPLTIQSVQTARGRPFDAGDWRGKWHLVVVASGACDADCRHELGMMRRVHASLGKEIDRLQRVWVMDGEPRPDVLRQMQAQYPDLIILPKAVILARQFDLPGTRSPGGVYLVDPLGNLFMRYPYGADPYGIRKDLVRLLTYSWTG